MRYTEEPFPPYQYTPGKNPHPIIHVDGHSYGLPERHYEFSVDTWQQSQRFLFGIDLLNHAYYWEAHEAIEDVWHCLDRQSPAAEYLQAIIMLSVSMLHRRRSMPGTARKVAEKAMVKLQGHEQDLYGCSLAYLRAMLTAVIEGREENVCIILQGI